MNDVLLGEAAGSVGHVSQTSTWLLWMGAALMAAGLYLLLPQSTLMRRRWGALLTALGVAAYFAAYAVGGASLPEFVFALLGVWTITTAAASIAMPSAVYAAVWFAASLVGVAGLLLYLGAQFLGAVTIAIYAGAIVVMFLFVIMLAQPRGQETYDRLAWSPQVKPLVVAVAALLPLLLVSWPLPPGTSPESLPRRVEQRPAWLEKSEQTGAQQLEHTSLLGRDFFSRYIVHVEVAGTLLLAALVGAVAIVLYGRTASRHSPGERHG
jgi:NADH-quinone oxidoreductase subunit J